MFRLTQHKILVIPHFIAAVSGIALLLSVMIEEPIASEQLTQVHQNSNQTECIEATTSPDIDITDPVVVRSFSLLHIF